MKVVKLTLIAIVSLGILFGLTPVAWAGGGPAGEECCIKEPKNLGGTIPMKATLAVYYDAANAIVDATIRLERSGIQRFYRVRITGVDITAASDEDIFCLLLNPCALPPGDNRIAVIGVVNAILKDFFDLDSIAGEPAAELLITNKSISDTDPNWEEQDARQIPEIDDRFMSIADVSVYVSEF